MKMDITLSKRAVLELYCYCRQAERSVDFGIASSAQWHGLIKYYTPEKRAKIISIVKSIEELVPHDYHTLPPVCPTGLEPCGRLCRVVKRCISLFKNTSNFSLEEIMFIYHSFRAFVTLLDETCRPFTSSIVEVRVSLHICELIIENRACGTPKLCQAANIEHYCQAAHIKAITLEQLGINGRDKWEPWEWH
jgi:hypothetical protein